MVWLISQRRAARQTCGDGVIPLMALSFYYGPNRGQTLPLSLKPWAMLCLERLGLPVMPLSDHVYLYQDNFFNHHPPVRSGHRLIARAMHLLHAAKACYIHLLSLSFQQKLPYLSLSHCLV